MSFGKKVLFAYVIGKITVTQSIPWMSLLETQSLIICVTSVRNYTEMALYS